MTSKPANSLKVVGFGHFSVIEHGTFTFSVSGISRALTHQLVRHRVASYSQQSMRYVNFENPEYIIPPSIKADPEKMKKFEDHMKACGSLYKELASSGIKAEDARFVLPIGSQTKIAITMNARELIHFFRLRCCVNAQWEIREMAGKMLEECKKVAPTIFKNAGPACVSLGYCTEGAKSCGKAPTLEQLKGKKQ